MPRDNCKYQWAIALSLAFCVFCSCNVPETQGNPLAGYTSVPPAPDPLPEQLGAPLEPLAAAGARRPVEQLPLRPEAAGVENGSFEVWSLGRPHHWRLAQGAVSKTTDAYDGDFAVVLVRETEPEDETGEDPVSKMPPEIRRLFAKHGKVFETEEEQRPAEPARLVYPLQAGDAVLGGQAAASVAARATAPGLLHITLGYRTCFGEQRAVTAAHPGSGEWETLVVEVPIKRDADPGSIELSLWRAPQTGGDAIADNAILTLTAPKD